jgi:hypothetical protein
MAAPRNRVGTLMPGLDGDPVDGVLEVLEDDEACLVVVDGEPEDWLVRFEKAADFAAREWAHNMARVYNRRRARPTAEARSDGRKAGPAVDKP